LIFFQPETVIKKVRDDFAAELYVRKHFAVILCYGSVVLIRQ